MQTENVKIVRAIGGPSAYGVCTTPIIEQVWVLCALSPTVGMLLAELISFQSQGCDIQIQRPVAAETNGISMYIHVCEP